MRPGRWVAMGTMLIGLPPAGVLLRGGSLAPYCEFPPQSRFIAHAPFSWVAFGLIGALIMVSVAPLLSNRACRKTTGGEAPAAHQPFPWLG